MRITCERCLRRYEIPAEALSSRPLRARCKCGARVVIHQADEETPEKSRAARGRRWFVDITSWEPIAMDDAQLQRGAREGRVAAETLVWTKGMAGWEQLRAVSELAGWLPQADPTDSSGQTDEAAPSEDFASSVALAASPAADPSASAAAPVGTAAVELAGHGDSNAGREPPALDLGREADGGVELVKAEYADPGELEADELEADELEADELEAEGQASAGSLAADEATQPAGAEAAEPGGAPGGPFDRADPPRDTDACSQPAPEASRASGASCVAPDPAAAQEASGPSEPPPAEQTAAGHDSAGNSSPAEVTALDPLASAEPSEGPREKRQDASHQGATDQQGSRPPSLTAGPASVEDTPAAFSSESASPISRSPSEQAAGNAKRSRVPTALLVAAIVLVGIILAGRNWLSSEGGRPTTTQYPLRDSDPGRAAGVAQGTQLEEPPGEAGLNAARANSEESEAATSAPPNSAPPTTAPPASVPPRTGTTEPEMARGGKLQRAADGLAAKGSKLERIEPATGRKAYTGTPGRAKRAARPLAKPSPTAKAGAGSKPVSRRVAGTPREKRAAPAKPGQSRGGSKARTLPRRPASASTAPGARSGGQQSRAADKARRAPPTAFNAESAQRQLEELSRMASACRSAGPTRGSGRVLVRVRPWGRVAGVTHLVQGFHGTRVGVCVMETFQRLRVEPFAGDDVTLDASFVIQ